MDRSNALQQELNHLQEGVGRLFGECQLPSDLPLFGGTYRNTVNIIHIPTFYIFTEGMVILQFHIPLTKAEIISRM